jgi:hypothetical protein
MIVINDLGRIRAFGNTRKISDENTEKSIAKHAKIAE